MKALAPLAALVLAATASACSGSVGGPDALSEEELVEFVTGDTSVPEGMDVEFSCEGGLEAEADATQDCAVEDANGGRTGLRVVVTGVDGEEMSYETADVFLYPEDVARGVEGVLAQQDFAHDVVECEDRLLGEVGESIECSVSGAEVDGVRAEVTRVDGLTINFDITAA